MEAQEFIEKWGPGGTAYSLNEKAGAQLHFVDLCTLLGVPTPSDAENYCFERGLRKTGEGQGYADVWMRKHFAWEYKAPGKSLEGALKQLMMYALPLVQSHCSEGTVPVVSAGRVPVPRPSWDWQRRLGGPTSQAWPSPMERWNPLLIKP